MDFTTLIINAQSALDAIAASDEFVKLLELGLWDDPAISLSDARQALEDLQKIYQSQEDHEPATVV